MNHITRLQNAVHYLLFIIFFCFLGVSYALRLYPNAYLIHILVGTAKGAGTGIIRVFDDVCLLVDNL